MLTNIPEVKLGIIAVSRDCFILSLSERRRAAIVEACKGDGLDVYECKTTVENEKDMLKAVDEVKAAGCNALVVFLGNFGPETPETLIAKNFDGPCMYVAAAEGDGDLINGRGDAYCGMLNCSYNLGMRHLKAFIPVTHLLPSSTPIIWSTIMQLNPIRSCWQVSIVWKTATAVVAENIVISILHATLPIAE